jgi:DNA mismatch endonuclease (patch repair protein)
MSRIRSKNTRVELILRRLLFRMGLRFRVHVPHLPGKPDIVFSRAKVAVFVDGDFWHGWKFDQWAHKLAPQWQAKIERNRTRDAAANEALRAGGWRVIRIWEHDLEAHPDRCANRVLRALNQRTKSQRRQGR